MCDNSSLNARVFGSTNRRGGLTVRLERSRPNSFDSQGYPCRRRIAWVSMVLRSSFLTCYLPLVGMVERSVEDFVPGKM